MVAGEASGDRLGADLLAELSSRLPTLIPQGVGGPRMRSAGLAPGPFDIHDLAVIGLAEVIRRLPRLIRVFRHLLHLLRHNRPHLLITIDLPDFNLMLASRARALGIPVVHYVSPQVWAWRANRVHDIARRVDHLLTLFPFEPPLYRQTGLDVTCVGHPLVRNTAFPTPEARQTLRDSFGVSAEERLLVLLPGSRTGELQRLLPTMLDTVRRLRTPGPMGDDRPLRVLLALADGLSVDQMHQHGGTAQEWPEGIILCQGRTYEAIMAADAALAASGTVTLETAMLGTPMVVIYRVNTLTYAIGRRVIRVPYISLVNLVAGRCVVPEYIQHEARPDYLAPALHHILTDTETVGTMRDAFREIRQQLAPPGQGPADVVLTVLRARYPELGLN